jgi:adaptin ear-binding coat-associated protein 1/2
LDRPYKYSTALGISLSTGITNMTLTAEQAGVPNEAAAYLKSLEDPTVIERVRCTIPEAHIFKLPTKPSSGGWRGADWDKEVWQGTLKVVERGDLTVVLLVDTSNPGSIFAVCPVKDGAVDRCVDSSRYFVLRVENGCSGKHMFIGMAFNERNDAFDFNTSLEDARREKEAEKEASEAAQKYDYGPSKDYSMKDGEKIHISVDKIATSGKKKPSGPRRNSAGGDAAGVGGFLKPSSKDTPRRASGFGNN